MFLAKAHVSVYLEGWGAHIQVPVGGVGLVIVSFSLKDFFGLFLRERESDRAGEGKRERRQRRRSRGQAPSRQDRTRCRAGTHELGGHDLSRSQTLND